jgi:hypothetical protein
MNAGVSKFIEATSARSFDSSAEAGTYWAKVCAAASAAEPYREEPPLEIEVDALWAIEKGNGPRMKLALALLGLFHRDPDALARLAEQAKATRRDGSPLDYAFVCAVLGGVLDSQNSELTKADLLEKIDRVAPSILPHSKKGRWTWMKKHALDWLPQRRPRLRVGFPKKAERRKP